MKVLVLTMYDNEEIIFQILKAGASGYLIKDSAMTDLVSAIRAIHQGDSYLEPLHFEKGDRRIHPACGNREEEGLATISFPVGKERFLQLIAEGNSIPQIASHLVHQQENGRSP